MRLISRILRQAIDIPNSSLFLEPPNASHFDRWVKVRSDSQDFLRPWEPTWAEDDLTIVGYKRRLAAYQRHRQSGWGRTFFLLDQADYTLLGGASLTRIRFGNSQSATLGYWMGVNHAGKGHMQKAVPALLSYAFDTLNLERVEAATLPNNERSKHLLTKCGFVEEGYAREYLEINGKREDHLLFSILRSDFKA